jgi:hypothetical protein
LICCKHNRVNLLKHLGRPHVNKDTELVRLAFASFANNLGRVVTYRALALTDDQLRTILSCDCIFASGAATTENDTGARQLAEGHGGLCPVLEQHGVEKVHD